MNEKLQKQLRAIKGIGPKRYQSIISQLIEMNQPIDTVFNMSATEIKSTFSIPLDVSQRIEEHNVQLSQVPKPISKKSTKDVSLTSEIIKVTKNDIEYPQQLNIILGKNAPDTLYMWGNLDLLNRPSVGFCGSRDVSDKGIEVTVDTAGQIAQEGWVVVSGHAKGVDTAAHRTALEHDAGTILVISEGIDRFKLRRELKRIAKPENLLVISQFERNDGWVSWRAMQRNQTIIALSDAMIILESRLKGGTYNAGLTAMKLKHPLYVAVYQDKEKSAGNEYFIKRGAWQLRKNRETNQANLEHLKVVVIQHRSQLQNSVTNEVKPEQIPLLITE